jgi:KAP family P-loop domain
MNRYVERPIETVQSDRLLRQDFVARLLDALIEPEGRATGVVVGLTGPSGSGKSSIINLVAERAELRHPASVLVRFNPWLAHSRNGLIHAFFAELTAAVGASVKKRDCPQPEKRQALAHTILKYGKRIAPPENVYLCDGGAAAAGLDTLRQSLPDGAGLHDMRAALAREMVESVTQILVLVDEVDRLDDFDIGVVVRLVREVASFEGVSYLLAYDADRLVPALGEGDRERGRACLEKVFQLQVTLPLPLPRQIRRIVEVRFRELVEEPDEHRQRLSHLLGILVPTILGTLRDAKRMLSGFETLHRLLRFEVDEVDLLGWAAILAKYPDVEPAFRRRQEQILGPGNPLFGEALLDRMLTGDRPTAVDVAVRSEPGALEELWLEEGGERLVSGPAARPLQRLLEFLFKSPWEGRRDRLNTIGATLPLAKTLAFGTLINAGEGGDAAPHPRFPDVISELGDCDAAAMTRALREAERNGNLAEYLVALHGCGHRVHPRLTEDVWPLDDIWTAFSDFAEPVPALTDPPREVPNRMLAKFISGPYLHRLGTFRRFLKPNLDTLHEWIGNGRFALAGHLLELQMTLEMDQRDEPGSIPLFVAEKDVAPLCGELAIACRGALLAGKLIDGIADLACLRAVLRGAPDGWDEESRHKLDEAVAQPELLDRFVWYCFGETEADVALIHAAALVADRAALRERVVARLRDAVELPEQIRRAHQIAESKL